MWQVRSPPRLWRWPYLDHMWNTRTRIPEYRDGGNSGPADSGGSDPANTRRVDGLPNRMEATSCETAASLGDPEAGVGLRPVGHGEHHHQRSHRAARRSQGQPARDAPSDRRPVGSQIHGASRWRMDARADPRRCGRGPYSNPRASSSGRPCAVSMPGGASKRVVTVAGSATARREPPTAETCRGRPTHGWKLVRSWRARRPPRGLRTAARRRLRFPCRALATDEGRYRRPRGDRGTTRTSPLPGRSDRRTGLARVCPWQPSDRRRRSFQPHCLPGRE